MEQPTCTPFLDALQGITSAKVANRAAARTATERACVEALEVAEAVWCAGTNDIMARGSDTTSAFLEEVVNLDAMRNENALLRRMQAALPDMLSDLETVELTAVKRSLSQVQATSTSSASVAIDVASAAVDAHDTMVERTEQYTAMDVEGEAGEQGAAAQLFC